MRGADGRIVNAKTIAHPFSDILANVIDFLLVVILPLIEQRPIAA